MNVIGKRIGVTLTPEIRNISRARSPRNLSTSLVRSDNLAKSIAQALLRGEKVVLLDVDYNSPLFGEKKTLRECVMAQLGRKKRLAKKLGGKVINLDHHTRELGHKTATELVFDNLDALRKLGGEVVVTVNHGDTDSVISSYVANNLDRNFSAEERKLLIAAARAGDHAEGDFLAPTSKLTDPVRLNLALDEICYEHGLFLDQVWRTNEDQIMKGMQALYKLIDGTLKDSRTLRTPETEALINKNPMRLSYQVVEDASQGKTVPGVRIDKAIDGHPIVIVDVSTPGLDAFNPITAYQASTHPAVILIQRNGRIVGIGKNKDHEWLNLLGYNGVEGIYTRFGMKLKGGTHAGGANVARDAFSTLPSPEEALEIVQEFLEDCLDPRPHATKASPPVTMKATPPITTKAPPVVKETKPSVNIKDFEMYKSRHGELSLEEYGRVISHHMSQEEYGEAYKYLLRLDGLPPSNDLVEMAAKLIGALGSDVPKEIGSDRPHAFWLLTEATLLTGREPGFPKIM